MKLLRNLVDTISGNIFSEIAAITVEQEIMALLWNMCEPENVAINDVLPLKAARRDAIANLKSSWSYETPTTELAGLPF